jgi:zinc transport system substrate-binding protein
MEEIRAALVAVDPGDAPIYDRNAAAFSSQLVALHERFAAGLARCERREIVVPHAAFAYLARRYRLTQLPIMASLSPDAEPSPAALAALTRQARRAGVTHVFFETLVTSKLADTLAREIGAAALVLNPVEGLTKEQEAQGVTYVQLMDANLANLRTALGCQ